jgi:hypothetical protein
MPNNDYMPKSDLTPIVDTWLTRKVLAEDVEYLKKKGGNFVKEHFFSVLIAEILIKTRSSVDYQWIMHRYRNWH